ncbi:MAG TPA: zinc finger MYND domain-containing protein [Dehalococcoidia bacterium]|nr:zinc finger MYND domain-containing protein [Dehalococcoidia bacterium]
MSVPDLYKIPNETSSSRLPEHGSQELIQYLTTLTFADGDNLFMRGVSNMPVVDISMITSRMTDGDGPENERVMKAAQMLTFNRLANRICEECSYKNTLTNLSICSDCALAWYCSKECQTRHWNTHKLRCCKRHGPLDDGYQAIVLAKVK